jgi:hypothetical protein
MRKIVLSLLSLGFVPAVASARPHFFGFFFPPVPVVVAAPAPVCVEPAPAVTFVAPAPIVPVFGPRAFFIHPPFWGVRHFHR